MNLSLNYLCALGGRGLCERRDQIGELDSCNALGRVFEFLTTLKYGL